MGRRHIIYSLLLGIWLVAGLVADEVFHVQNKKETFFSAPHLIINLGIIALVIRVIWILQLNHRLNKPLLKGTGILAAIVFLLGGIGDIILHLNGVQDESLFSRPTHLLILVGGLIFALPTGNRK